MKKLILVIFVFATAHAYASDSSVANRKILIDGLGGMSKDSLCKLSALHAVLDGSGGLLKDVNYTHKSVIECQDAASKGKGIFITPDQWQKSFEQLVDDKYNDWANDLRFSGKNINGAFIENLAIAFVKRLKEKEELQHYVLEKAKEKSGKPPGIIRFCGSPPSAASILRAPQMRPSSSPAAGVLLHCRRHCE